MASRTALGVALRRAAHQVLDEPVVFRDELAERIAGRGGGAAKAGGSLALRAFIAARSRFAEDELAVAFERGVRQYVVLGAGLDTFAYRNPFGAQLRVFEVDHPDTQLWKRDRLQAAGIAVPEWLRFVAVDFQTGELAEALKRAPGFVARRPAFFSMLGVAPYLTKGAFATTVAEVSSLCAGSGVVFDYAATPALLNLADRVRLGLLSARVARSGEEFRLFLSREELDGLLGESGFGRIEDLGQEEINARYFAGRSDGLRIGSAVGRLISAVA